MAKSSASMRSNVDALPPRQSPHVDRYDKAAMAANTKSAADAQRNPASVPLRPPLRLLKGRTPGVGISLVSGDNGSGDGDGGGGGGGGAGRDSGGYHLLSEASHQPSPCDLSLILAPIIDDDTGTVR